MRRINWRQASAISIGASLGGVLTLMIALSIEDLVGKSLFGEGWYFFDLFVYCGIPFLDFLLVLAGANLGALLANFIYGYLSQDKVKKQVDRKLIFISSIGAAIGGLAGDFISFWVFNRGFDYPYAFDPSSVTSLQITPYMLVGAFLGALFIVIVYMFTKDPNEAVVN